ELSLALALRNFLPGNFSGRRSSRSVPSRSHFYSVPQSEFFSGFIPRARPPGSTRSKPCATNNGFLPANHANHAKQEADVVMAERDRLLLLEIRVHPRDSRADQSRAQLD